MWGIAFLPHHQLVSASILMSHLRPDTVSLGHSMASSCWEQPAHKSPLRVPLPHCYLGNTQTQPKGRFPDTGLWPVSQPSPLTAQQAHFLLPHQSESCPCGRLFKKIKKNPSQEALKSAKVSTPKAEGSKSNGRNDGTRNQAVGAFLCLSIFHQDTGSGTLSPAFHGCEN